MKSFHVNVFLKCIIVRTWRHKNLGNIPKLDLVVIDCDSVPVEMDHCIVVRVRDLCNGGMCYHQVGSGRLMEGKGEMASTANWRGIRYFLGHGGNRVTIGSVAGCEAVGRVSSCRPKS